MSSTKGQRESASVRYSRLEEELLGTLPHLYGVCARSDDFISLLCKVRDDGTVLAVVKQYSGDGGPMVLFGSGYGLAGALVAADAAVQGNRWKSDKPWAPSAK